MPAHAVLVATAAHRREIRKWRGFGNGWLCKEEHITKTVHIGMHMGHFRAGGILRDATAQ